MNHKLFISTILLSIFITMASSAQLESADNRNFIEDLRKHDEHNTLREFEDEFRKKVEQDSDGTLIKEISKNPSLNTAIFHHLDAIPEKYVELVLANWLEDDTKWGLGERGGFYYSPAGRIEHWLRVYISPQDSNDLKSSSALSFVLENRDSRQALAKVLLACYSTEELSSEEIRERRTKAWAEIVNIVEQSFPLLLEEDKRHRTGVARMPNAQPEEFSKETKEEKYDSLATDQANGKAKAAKNRWMRYLTLLMVAVGVAGFLLRSRITKTRKGR